MQLSGTSSNKPGRVSETARAQLSDKMRRDLQKELERTGISLEQVLARYHLERIEQMKNYGWEGMRFMLDMDIYLDQLI